MNRKGCFWERIRLLHMWKRKYFRILVIAEALLLFLAAANLFGKDTVYEFGSETSVPTEGIAEWRGEQGGFYARQGAASGILAEFRNVSLPAGSYRVELSYDTDTNMKNNCVVADSSIAARNLRTNGTGLFAGLQKTNFEMWLLQDTSRLAVQVLYAGEGNVGVRGLTIYETNAMSRVLFFLAFCLFAAVNICCVFAAYDKAYAISQKKKNVMFGLGLVTVFASLPLFVDAMPGAGDLIYHLMRVEGIRDGLLAGQFPIRISPNWQQGYGYASPVFYGETLLYPAALFRLIGFDITAGYRLYMFLVVAATVLIAYFSFRKIFQNEYVGLFCSMLYSLSVYRIYKTYLSGSWGEMLGIMLLPILAYGFYRVFSADIHERKYKKSWVPLTIGFSLLVQSHLLTGEMVGFFTVILCIVLLKKVFRKETFTVLAKTVIYSILLSAWFLIPFADYMLTGDFVIHHVSGRTIQNRGLYPAHLLFTFFKGGTNVFFEDNGMAHSQPMGVGITLIAALVIFGLLLFNRKTEGLKTEEIALGKICGWFAAAAMLMSLSIFPWDKIQSLGGIAATLVSSIQFPNRFLTIANVCLVIVAGVAAKYFLVNGKKIWSACYVGGMAFLLCISSLFLMNDMLNTIAPVRAYNSEGIGTGYIAGAEYLPYGADASQFWYHDPVGSEDITVQDYERKEPGAEVWVKNTGNEKGEVAFSLLYYKGYRAYDTESGEELCCRAGNNFEVTVEVPAGYEGRIAVAFESPRYWRAGELLSVLTLSVMVFSAVYFRKKQREE